MRVTNEDEIEVAVQHDPRKLTLNDLGLSEDDLAQMDERQNPADSFEFDNVVWLYRQSADATANAAAPISSSRRRPIRSPSVPMVISDPATRKP